MRGTRIDELLEAARSGFQRLEAPQAFAALLAGATLVDVRTADQLTRDGRIKGALEISLNVLEWRLDPGSPHRHPQAPGLDDQVIVICGQGYSSSLAAGRLQQLGFRHATDVIGGFEAWQASGLPVTRTVGVGVWRHIRARMPTPTGRFS